MDDVNLDGAKVWTKAQAEKEATRLNEAVTDNPFLSYQVVPVDGGFTVVLRSGSPTSPQGE